MQQSKYRILIAFFLIISGCHTLTVVNNAESDEWSTSKEVGVKHYFLGFAGGDYIINNECSVNWSNVHISRKKTDIIKEGALDSLGFIFVPPFLVGAVGVSAMVQAVYASPMYYRKTTLKFDCPDSSLVTK